MSVSLYQEQMCLNNTLLAFANHKKTYEDVLYILRTQFNTTIDIDTLKEILDNAPKYPFVPMWDNSATDEQKSYVLEYLDYIMLFEKYGINCYKAYNSIDHVRKCFEYKLLDLLPREYAFFANKFEDIFKADVFCEDYRYSNLLREFVFFFELTYVDFLNKCGIASTHNNSENIIYEQHIGDKHPYYGKAIIFKKNLEIIDVKSETGIASCKYMPFLVKECSLDTRNDDYKKGVLVYYQNVLLPVMEDTFDTFYWYQLLNYGNLKRNNYKLQQMGFNLLNKDYKPFGKCTYQNPGRDIEEMLYIVDTICKYAKVSSSSKYVNCWYIDSQDNVTCHEALRNNYVSNNIEPYISKYFGYLSLQCPWMYNHYR